MAIVSLQRGEIFGGKFLLQGKNISPKIYLSFAGGEASVQLLVLVLLLPLGSVTTIAATVTDSTTTATGPIGRPLVAT